VNRREFISLLGGATVWSIAARAQQRAFPVIGLLSSRSPSVDTPLIAVIRQALNETGLVEGQNVTLDYRWADGQYDRLAGLAADLVRQQVGVIVTIGGEPSALGGQGSDRDHTDRLCGRCRPDQERPRHQRASSWRQHHGCNYVP
jgi:putative ABC transport system substrate-binding protein